MPWISAHNVVFLPCSPEAPPEGTSRPHIQDCNIVQTGVGIAGVCYHNFDLCRDWDMQNCDTDRSKSINRSVQDPCSIILVLNLFAPGSGGLVRPSNAETDIPPTVRTGYDIYYYQLLAERRGSPIWIPGPDMNLPTEYRKEGTRIGDVGILYCSEGFGFLFNIFLPADHPINQGRVPPGFEPLNLSKLEHELKKQVVFGPKSYLTSTSVTTSSNMDSSFVSGFHVIEGAHDSLFQRFHIWDICRRGRSAHYAWWCDHRRSNVPQIHKELPGKERADVV